MSPFQSLLVHHFQPLSSEQLTALEQHYELLLRWNQRMNLTTTVALEEAVIYHYCESLFVGTHLPPGACSVVDVGTGAGFPGYPIAVLRPDCSVTLLESNTRKCVFLREATRQHANIQVSEGRSEAIEERFDFSIARAVPWKSVLPSMKHLGSKVMLLVGKSDSRHIVEELALKSFREIPIPWGRSRVLLIGDVPRETCA